MSADVKFLLFVLLLVSLYFFGNAFVTMYLLDTSHLGLSTKYLALMAIVNIHCIYRVRMMQLYYGYFANFGILVGIITYNANSLLNATYTLENGTLALLTATPLVIITTSVLVIAMSTALTKYDETQNPARRDRDLIKEAYNIFYVLSRNHPGDNWVSITEFIKRTRVNFSEHQLEIKRRKAFWYSNIFKRIFLHLFIDMLPWYNTRQYRNRFSGITPKNYIIISKYLFKTLGNININHYQNSVLLRQGASQVFFTEQGEFLDKVLNQSVFYEFSSKLKIKKQAYYKLQIYLYLFVQRIKDTVCYQYIGLDARLALYDKNLNTLIRTHGSSLSARTLMRYLRDPNHRAVVEIRFDSNHPFEGDGIPHKPEQSKKTSLLSSLLKRPLLNFKHPTKQ